MLDSYINYVDKLDGDYKRVFKQIEDYVKAEIIDEIRKEEILNEVLDSFLSAQEEKKPVEQIVGKNTEKFCKTICSEKTVGSRLLFFVELMFSFVVLIWIDFITAVFEMISEGETAHILTYRTPKDITSVLVGCLIASLIICFFKFCERKFMFRFKAHKIMSIIIQLAVVVGLIILINILPNDDNTKGTYLWIWTVCCVVCTAIYGFISWKKRNYNG